MKQKFTNGFLACFFVVSFICFGLIETHASEWKAGVSSTVITPKEPMWTAGYGGRKEPAKGTISDLYLKALAIEDPSGNKAVIVTADLIGFNFDTCERVSKAIEARYNIPRNAILFNASHTHGGPEMRPFRDDIIPGYHQGIMERNAIPEYYMNRIPVYVRWLEGEMVKVIGEAITGMEPAVFSFSTARPTPFAVSRRFPDGEGGVLYRSNPSSYYTGGPRDDTVPVLKVERRNGSVKAILFGYAAHPITLSENRFNGDYPGFAQEFIEKDFPGAVAMFMQGCSGQLVPNARHQTEYAIGHGRALATAVRNTMEGGKFTPLSGPLKTAYTEAALEFVPLPPRTVLASESQGSGAGARKASILLAKMDKGQTVDLGMNCPLQAISFGEELLLIGISGDVVVDYAVKVKSEFAERASFVWASAYCNGYIWGYLPTYNILKEGGYESSDRFPLGPFTDDVEDRVMNSIRGLVRNVTGR